MHHAIQTQRALYLQASMQRKTRSKNISIKMLKDVGMTVPKSRDTSAVYMLQNRGLSSLHPSTF